MKKLLTKPLLGLGLGSAVLAGTLALGVRPGNLEASSHREAPLISYDPLADNTDVYAFRSPDDPNTVTIIANYIPFQLPQGGPVYYNFGENVRYEIHIKNRPSIATAPGVPTSAGDDITYRFTFTLTNEDLTTHFRIRNAGAGVKENQKATYTCEVSRDNGATFTTIVTGGVVPPYNVGPRAISNATVGFGAANYRQLITNSIQTVSGGTSAGTKVFCGTADDPFFVDIGAVEDLGNIRATRARDGLYHKNVNCIALQIPIAQLQRDGLQVSAATSILDPAFVIGVWASASRPALRTIVAPDASGNTTGAQTTSGNYVQVSRLGMPLTNEVVSNYGNKNEFNARTPYSENRTYDVNFTNPELALYMADNVPTGTTAPKPAGQTYFGEAVPGFSMLRIQSKSLAGATGLPAAGFDFRNGAAGLSGLAGSTAVAGTALAPIAQGGYGEYLLRAGQPRSVDILPIFHTGVPNVPPFQLATGKNGNPLAAGKPFINNFLPVGTTASLGGDMLRLNMAVPVTPRTDPDFSSEGLLAAAKLGLTDARFNTTTTLQNIPNMDGFPNGRRLEDDAPRIELQTVSGVVLASLGLWYDDYTAGATNPVTAQLNNVLTFTTGVERNDTTIRTAWPFMQDPWSGTKAQPTVTSQRQSNGLGLQAGTVSAKAFPNPVVDQTTIRYDLAARATLTFTVTDMAGRKIATLATDKTQNPGTYDLVWKPASSVAPGQYILVIAAGKTVLQSIHLEKH
ncbi:DUF4331 family protein [Hymenobacter convexus]|uniref:DUF4331 family protein n=1 Tax=Hymenobacter sp. CA1UV-4 TaxID=3063782 RepID=UPI002713EE63|nr:DUF4331 family protein [Hymenobacter sp. CA1UV-4]MDO7853098.1 DUF4331 family protein [Hymenobacter sp. CA1UV-4]